MLGGLVGCSNNEPEPTPSEVAEPITSIRISKQNLGLLLVEEYDDEGNPTGVITPEEYQLEVTTLPRQKATPVVKYASSNESIAKVDGSGKVTAVGEGNCEISVSSEDGTVTSICPVYVAKAKSKSQAGKVASGIKAAQSDIKVDTIKENVYWNNKRTKNGKVIEDTYFDRTTIVSKENAYFYMFDKDTYIKTEDGNPSYSSGGWVIYTNEYYDTYLFHDNGDVKTYMVADSTSYISKGKTRFQAMCSVLDSLFTSGSEIVTNSYDDIYGSKSGGPLDSASTSKRRGSSASDNLIMSISDSGQQSADQEDENDYYIPAGTTYEITIDNDYIFTGNMCKSATIAQVFLWDQGEDKYTNGYFLEYDYKYQNVDLIYPNAQDYQRVDTIFDL